MPKPYRFLVAESEAPEDRDKRRDSAGRSSGGQGGGFGQPQQVADEPWGQPSQQAQPASGGDVWGAPGTSYNDETPF